MTEQLYSKNGGPPMLLPDEDVDAEGYIRTGLRHDPEMRASLGWVESPCPTIISQMQGKQQLQAMGLYDTVNDMVMASGDNDLIIYWQSSQDWHRDHPKVNAFGDALGMDDQAKNNFFTLAKQIT